METSADKEVFLRGDSAVQYQDLMNVIDALKAAGVAEHRHGGENAERALMDVTDVLRDRMQRARRAAADDLRVGRGARRAGGAR